MRIHSAAIRSDNAILTRMHTNNESTPAPLLRLPAIKEKTGLSAATIYRYMKAGKFPKPIKIGDRAVAWLSDEVEIWSAERVAHSRETVAHA